MSGNMSGNMLNEIKNICLKQKIPAQPLLKPIEFMSTNFTLEKATEQSQETPQIKNKLITCYEEDYTRNSNEIMRFWQRN
jgi:hypothetical protein